MCQPLERHLMSQLLRRRGSAVFAVAMSIAGATSADGHLPYPFGREVTGYQVPDLDETITKAKASGAVILFQATIAASRRSAILQFPGGYIAEVHARTSQ
jgi:predicted enzyme related to lactoylglutathione lyase